MSRGRPTRCWWGVFGGDGSSRVCLAASALRRLALGRGRRVETLGGVSWAGDGCLIVCAVVGNGGDAPVINMV